MAWKADDSTLGKYNIESKMFPTIILTFLNVFEGLGILTEGHNGIPYKYHRDVLENVNKSKYGRDEYRVAANALFAGAKGTMPGFPNALVGGQNAEKWCSPYRHFPEKPKSEYLKSEKKKGAKKETSEKKLPSYTSEHAGRDRTPQYESSKLSEIDRVRYICAMANGKTRDDAITAICTFEAKVGSQSRVLCVKSGESTQQNKLGDSLAKSERSSHIDKLIPHPDLEKSKKRQRNWPQSALTKILPYIVLGQDEEIKIYRNDPVDNPERVSLFQFISETDGAARREYREQFGGEYPWLTDAHIKDILDFYSEYFPYVMTPDRRKELEALLS